MKDWMPAVVAVIAATVALVGYIVNSAVSTRTEKSQHYAEALAAIERYRQLPFTFRRRHDGTPGTRAELATTSRDGVHSTPPRSDVRMAILSTR